MVEPIFRSPQVKRCAIITYKHGIYELPHELPNDLKLRILGNWKISVKFSRSGEWVGFPKEIRSPLFNLRKFLKNEKSTA